MSIIDFLIVLACLATGYWIVSSIIGSDSWNDAIRKPDAADRPSGSPEAAPMRDWHIVLDIPRDSSPRDIQAAMKRRLAQAEADRDAPGADRIRRAAEAGLRERR
jgi:hypothetical protein